MKHECFDDKFKCLWKEPKFLMLWDILENLYNVLKKMANEQAAKQLHFRTITDIDRDMKSHTRPMEELSVECINIFWSRVILRTQLKVRDALQLLFYSANTGNAYGCALASRSILEHVAILEYLADEIPWKNSSVSSQKDLGRFIGRIHKLAFGSRFDWDKLLNQPGSVRQILKAGKWDRPDKVKIPFSSDLIRALDKKLFASNRIVKDSLRLFYSILCDVVHPSWGGDFIYSTSNMYREMTSTQDLDQHFKLSVKLFCPPIVELVKHLVALSLELGHLEPKYVR